ncbi:helix-turn-helix domain-containing protein [Streptococcus oralis]|uniref:helix-turn-helix domain-containing protein n=1 Tax=Streptococcus oralis TaxID=1303 RepID=UPI00228487BA|nr:helix-turn-helix transcriptional regulator [Streptococcus oralis]MCY7103320.1 helix-turn-helix domain-containing protein [Streptococcus oralis]
MITEYGKFLRKLRIDQGQILKTMAEKLGVSSAFLSAVENGKKKIPKTWEEKLVKEYKLDEEQLTELRRSQQDSQQLIEINLAMLTDAQKDTAFAFARSLERFDTQDLSNLAKFFNKNSEEVNDL